jgi:3-dehydroquinate synthase
MFIKMPNYEIVIETGGIKSLGKWIHEIYTLPNVFVVTDKNVFQLYHQTLIDALPDFILSFVVIEPGELSKSMSTYQEVISKLIELGMKRNHLLVALGGGVVGDLTGFVASTLFRGVSYIQIPTTLLAQVDSSIGGKVGIDLPQGKNLIGSFYDPKLVMIDPLFLSTLDQREYNNGLAEMIKVGLIGDKHLYQYLLSYDKVTEKEIAQAIAVKRDLVLIDPFDKKERMYLNFGHTFGHAIEKKHQYQTYKHGEAISYGMLIALEIGIRLGETKPELYEEVKELLKRLELVKEPLLNPVHYADAILTDKKYLSDGLNYIIVPRVGVAKIIKLKESDWS